MDLDQHVTSHVWIRRHEYGTGPPETLGADPIHGSLVRLELLQLPRKQRLLDRRLNVGVVLLHDLDDGRTQVLHR